MRPALVDTRLHPRASRYVCRYDYYYEKVRKLREKQSKGDSAKTQEKVERNEPKLEEAKVDLQKASAPLMALFAEVGYRKAVDDWVVGLVVVRLSKPRPCDSRGCEYLIELLAATDCFSWQCEELRTRIVAHEYEQFKKCQKVFFATGVRDSCACWLLSV